LDNRRLLLVRPIDPMTEKPTGEAQLCVEGGVGADLSADLAAVRTRFGRLETQANALRSFSFGGPSL